MAKFQYLIVYVLFLHFLADFVFQTNWMAAGKYKSWRILSVHVCEYLIVLWIGLAPFKWKYAYCFLNSGIHFFVDAISSRLTHRFYEQMRNPDKREVAQKCFWITIGFDQFIHVAILISTLFWFG